MQTAIDGAWELLTAYGLKALAAIVILVAGNWVVRIVRNLLKRAMVSRRVDTTVSEFVGNLAYYALLTFVVLAALSQLGIQTTSLIAVVGAAGLAVGLALQGSLSNFAAGFLLIIFRPFKVGDFIEAAGTAGTVEAIQIFTTQLLTPDNKTVIIPNAGLTAGNIVNISSKGSRRVDLTLGIGCGDDIDKARRLVTDILDGDARVFKEPPPAMVVTELGSTSITFAVRAWAKAADYWDVYSETLEKARKAFDAAGIRAPCPRRDVQPCHHDSEGV